VYYMAAGGVSACDSDAGLPACVLLANMHACRFVCLRS